MTEKEMQQTKIVKAEDVQLPEWHSRENVLALARRLKAMLPGGDRLSLAQAMATAQYAMMSDANPFRGEIYAYPDRGGQLVLVDGYKLLVRWAKRQAPYAEKFEPLPADQLREGDIGYTCWILRDDNRPLLRDLIGAGADFREAYEIAASAAVGIVRKEEMTSQKTGRPIPPPKGWDWDQVARKRALKNALNLSHGAPSPREIARETWLVGDTETIPEDWQQCKPEMLPAERERLAALNAQERDRREEWEQMTEEEIQETLERNLEILHGEPGQDRLL